MSLYYVEKLIYQLNRDPAVRSRFLEDMEGVLEDLRPYSGRACRHSPA